MNIGLQILRLKAAKSLRSKTRLFILLVGLTCCQSGCVKDYLAVKRDKNQAVPVTLDQFQAILDYDLLNRCWPEMGLLASDNMYMLDDYYLAAPDYVQENYTWRKNVYDEGSYLNGWSLIYNTLFYSNVVLDGLKDMPGMDIDSAFFNNIKGQALFLRASEFFNLAQIFAKTYDNSSANTDLGIPLRLTSDLNAPTIRATVQQTYDRIIQDLSTSVPLLPLKPRDKTRASKPAALAMLARTYLVMGDYTKALDNANECLELYDSLMDYNMIDTSLQYPFPLFNKETIFFATMLTSPSNLFSPKARVDLALYNSYEDNDLRKALFFKPIEDNGVGFYGDYTGEQDHFSGIATDEVILIAAECNARLGKKDQAIEELNELLKTRYKKGTFIPLTATNADQALNSVLFERRKELAFRGSRWTDLRRLNLDPKTMTTITRIVNGQTYTLKPNDLRYVFQIPEDVIKMADIPQNP